MNTIANNLHIFFAAVKKIDASLVILQNDDLIPYEKNTLGLTRKLQAVIQVTAAHQINEIIRLANHYRVSLYPVSTGKNWGLGSRSPVTHDCVLIDMHAMNAILEINIEFGYARIEPGVTQAQLAQALVNANAPFFIDVTGSARDTSIIGNTLERGTAYNSLRAETLINMNVILGNGETITTGFDSSSPVSNLYPYGIGPDLLGVFLQSNYGVCISACIKLQPRQESHTAFIASVNHQDELQKLVDGLRTLFTEKIIDCVIHIGNERRRDISLTPIIFSQLTALNARQSRTLLEDIVRQEAGGTWSAVGSIMGTKEHVAQAQKAIKKKFKDIAKVSFMDQKKYQLLSRIANWLSLNRKACFLHAVKPLIGLTQGIPTNEMLRSIYWPAQNTDDNWIDPDASNNGVYFCTPILPMNAASINSALAIIEHQSKKFSVKPAVTMNTLRGCALECVISIDFIKSEANSRSSAHNFISNTLDNFIAAGFPPYRIDIDNMNKIFGINPPLRSIARQLKSVFDPNNIIVWGAITFCNLIYIKLQNVPQPYSPELLNVFT